MSGIPDLSPLPPRTGSSAILKVVAIGILGCGLLIPLAMIWILVAERAARRDQVVSETTASVGRAQTVGGVVFDLPYDVLERRENGSTFLVTRHAYVFPERLDVEATSRPKCAAAASTR